MTKFTIYKAKDGWRWRLKAANGRIIAESGEAYTRKHGAWRAAVRICRTVPTETYFHLINGCR